MRDSPAITTGSVVAYAAVQHLLPSFAGKSIAAVAAGFVGGGVAAHAIFKKRHIVSAASYEGKALDSQLER